MHYLYFANKMIKEAQEEMAKKQESILEEQLCDFVSRGLIEIQKTEMILVQEKDTNKVCFKQAVRLVLKDKEYIEKLEQENKELREFKAQFTALMGKS